MREKNFILKNPGVLAALLVEIARLNRASPEDRVEEETETYKYDHPRTGFCFLSLYGGYPDRGSGEDLPYQ